MKLVPSLSELLGRWLPAQRWYPARGREVSLHRLGGIRLEDPAGEVGLEVHIIAVESAGRVDVLNVPLTSRGAPLAGAERALIGRTEQLRDAGGDDDEYDDGDGRQEGPDTGVPGERWIYDGARDPVFIHAWLDLMRSGKVSGAPDTDDDKTGSDETGSDETGSDETRATGAAVTGHAAPVFAARPRPAAPGRCTVLAGEQSNTSVVIDDPDQPAILKFFRVLSSGPNPDVEVGVGLTNAGSAEVPQTYGWVTGRWRNPTTRDGLVGGHLSVLREFIAGSEDAWRSASTAAAAGIDYTRQARELGEVTARIHLRLREAFGVRTAAPVQLKEFTTALIGRIEWAWAEAGPSVGPYEDVIRAGIEALRQLAGTTHVGTSARPANQADQTAAADPVDPAAGAPGWPLLQRIHGDYHLGQVLHSPVRGWVVLDFEGEPLRAASERRQLDVALRDVVGMLRSFDYAGSVGTVLAADSTGPDSTGPDSTGLDSAAADSTAEGSGDGSDTERGAAGRNWAAACNAAFLAGYEAELGEPVDIGSALFRALWLDKALYEVVYELRNRPHWLQIPVRAVREKLTGPVAGDNSKGKA